MKSTTDQPELVKEAQESLPKENIVPNNDEEGKPLAEIQRFNSSMPEGTELAAEMPLSENVSLQNMMPL